MVPLANNKFIPSYYFLLANSISLLSDSDDMRVVINGFKEKLSDRYMGLLAKTDPLTNDEREICAAIEVLLASIDPSTPLVSDENKGKMAALNEKGYFDPNLYRDIDGKLLIVQVFDKEDTQDEHWQLTQTWFRRYAMPRVGDEGELIYETPTTRVILYMGDNDEANQQFVRNTLTQTPNALLTFRGHAYSLANNFPYDIFSDAGHVLFIPGSCGSAGRIANYVFANPDIDLRFFSNTSTGRGQVTNALLSALINSNERIPFRDLLKKAEDQIIANGGDPKTIYAWMAGESLLAYVNTIRSS
jgi:hypothetical protein